jgi:hypothetical protein
MNEVNRESLLSDPLLTEGKYRGIFPYKSPLPFLSSFLLPRWEKLDEGVTRLDRAGVLNYL